MLRTTMAVWQFDLVLVPKGGSLPRRSGDGHDAPSVDPKRVEQARSWLVENVGAPWQMLEGWYVYGGEKGNRVDVLLSADASAEITARIDAREEATSFIRKLCALAELLDCLLFSLEMWSLVDVSPSALGFALERSSAATFVRTPESVLRGDEH